MSASHGCCSHAGVGIQFGSLSPAGGRLVEAPLAESPAEAAGVGRGDRVLEIGKQ